MKSLGSSSKLKMPSAIRISLPIYFLLSVGVSLQISGSNWDIVWHGVGNVETFFTPPHLVIYSGVALALGSIIMGSIQWAASIGPKKKDVKWFVLVPLSFPFPFKLAAAGCLLQISAGPFDFWWHSLFGFDGLLSPPHSVLAAGMLMAALGALTGINIHCSYPRRKNNNRFSLLLSKLYFSVGYAIFLMVSVGIILMFTLPFSKGQYFDFNPNPFAALAAASVFIPFVFAIYLFTAAKNSSCSTIGRLPFVLSPIVAVVMLIQSATTITSNSYFGWLFPLYLLNIIPALVSDILILGLLDKNRHKTLIDSISLGAVKAKKISTMNRYLAASLIVSIFYLTLFFPWTVDIYGGYFEPPDTVRTEQFFVQLLLPVILPISLPVTIVSSLTGGLVAQKLIKTEKLGSMILS
jgi:hypothetical protein